MKAFINAQHINATEILDLSETPSNLQEEYVLTDNYIVGILHLVIISLIVLIWIFLALYETCCPNYFDYRFAVFRSKLNQSSKHSRKNNNDEQRIDKTEYSATVNV